MSFKAASQTKEAIFTKYEFIVPLLLFVIFLVFTLPGISWGAPSTWHPDEIVIRSIKALHGEWVFDQTNFDYPTLPQYVMLGVGRVVFSLGRADRAVLIACRILSAILTGLTIVLTYIIVRRMRGGIHIAALSGLFLLCVSDLAHNGRFAHNDIYITLFTLLTVYSLINYVESKKNVWLYISFLMVGMTASSKYNGICLVIVPVLLYLISQRHFLPRQWPDIFGTLILGGSLTYLGFAIGTPTALLRPVYYFQNMIPALLHTGNYWRQPDSVRGIVGQYGVIVNGLGLPLVLLFFASLFWAGHKMIQVWKSGAGLQSSQSKNIFTLLLCLFSLDLPIMVSYNYQLRFFLPMMPIFAMLGAFFIGEIYRWMEQKPLYQKNVTALLGCVVLFSLARNVSVMLLFLNDARIPAGEFLESLPYKTSLEYTYYPPTIPAKHFSSRQNYPVYFVKVPGDPIPTDPGYEFNVGEAGLNERETTYLVTDSFTWKKFNNPYVCESMQVECDFFKQLAGGRSDHYLLIAEFSYSLPPFLPQIEIAFVNPEIRIYERIK